MSKENLKFKLFLLKHLFDLKKETYYKICIGFDKNLNFGYYTCDEVTDEQDKGKSDYMISSDELVIWTQGDLYDETIDLKYNEIRDSMIDETSHWIDC